MSYKKLNETTLKEGDIVEVCFIEASGGPESIVFSYPAIIEKEADSEGLWLNHHSPENNSRHDRLGTSDYDFLMEAWPNNLKL